MHRGVGAREGRAAAAEVVVAVVQADGGVQHRRQPTAGIHYMTDVRRRRCCQWDRETERDRGTEGQRDRGTEGQRHVTGGERKAETVKVRVRMRVRMRVTRCCVEDAMWISAQE